jgi:carbamoyl-phosphate synthase large subunit
MMAQNRMQVLAKCSANSSKADQEAKHPTGLLRVLIFPGGTEIGLEIGKALSFCKDICLYSAGLDVPNHASYFFARHFTVPSIRQAGWMEAINAIVREHRIDFIFPAYDDILLALVENAEHLMARVVTSPLETCRVTRSKSLTYEALRDISPRLYNNIDDVDKYPVFVKPDRGQGSEGAKLIPDELSLRSELYQDPDILVMEHLPGEEYTVDCFSDRERGLFCRGRARRRIKSGISMACHVEHDPAFIAITETIGSRLDLHGAWFFQVKRNDSGDLRLLEVAPRIAGGMCLHRVLGINFPLLSLYEHLRLPYRILINELDVTLERALVNRYQSNIYYDSVYLDLDDTLIYREKVNIELVRFLYQCVNNQKKLILLTRHSQDVHGTLRQYGLSGLFNEIVVLDQKENKSKYITSQQAIFIDDSFREREEVKERLGIPTFDCSMIEMLLDDRI